MEQPKNPRELSFEDKLLTLLSRIDLSIQSVASAVNPPFPKEELINPSDELSKQFEEREKEERQTRPLYRQNKILLVSLIISILASAASVSVQIWQATIANTAISPQIRLISAQIPNEKQIYSDNQIRIYNYGRPISNLKVDSFVLIEPDNLTLATKNKKLILNGYYFYSTLDNKEDNLEMIISGVKNNNILYHNLSNEIYNSVGTFLSLETYFKINYIDANNKPHTDFYWLDDFEAKKISNAEGKNIEKKRDNLPPVDLEKTSSKELLNLFGLK